MSNLEIGKDNSFIESDCKINFDGREYESGGSWLLRRVKDNKLVGILYAYDKEDCVSSWSGDLKIPAHFGNEWYSNFGDKRQSVYFTYCGKNFYGVYYKSGSCIVRVREIKER